MRIHITGALAILLAALMLLSAPWVHGQAPEARRWHLSAACRPKLKVAFSAVEDMDALGSLAAFESAVAEAKKELRQARAVAITSDDRTAAEQIEVYRLKREACSTQRSPDAYRDCEKDAGAVEWAISYGLGIAKVPPR